MKKNALYDQNKEQNEQVQKQLRVMREQIKLKKQKVIAELNTLRSMQHHRLSQENMPTSLPQLSQSRALSSSLNEEDQRQNSIPSMHHSSTNLSKKIKFAAILATRKTSPQNFSKLTPKIEKQKQVVDIEKNSYVNIPKNRTTKSIEDR